MRRLCLRAGQKIVESGIYTMDIRILHLIQYARHQVFISATGAGANERAQGIAVLVWAVV
jgi:hypothetical protein